MPDLLRQLEKSKPAGRCHSLFMKVYLWLKLIIWTLSSKGTWWREMIQWCKTVWDELDEHMGKNGIETVGEWQVLLFFFLWYLRSQDAWHNRNPVEFVVFQIRLFHEASWLCGNILEHSFLKFSFYKLKYFESNCCIFCFHADISGLYVMQLKWTRSRQNLAIVNCGRGTTSTLYSLKKYWKMYYNWLTLTKATEN